jgi:LysM repeat protein
VTGDYPSTIASKTGLSWDKIASLNNISADGYNADGSAIHAGQVLKLK